MNIKTTLEEKEGQIKKEVDEINQLQQMLNNKNQELLRLDGAIKQLQELVEEDKNKDFEEKALEELEG